MCVNVLDLFYAYGRESQLQQTLKWVHDVLMNRAYLEGTRYYETPECFLYFMSRFLSRSRDADLHALLKPLLQERIQERIGAEGNSSALSMRILTCDFVGIRDEIDLRKLLTLQCEDGGWEIGWIYRLGYRVSALATVDFLRHLLSKLLKQVLRRNIRSIFRTSKIFRLCAYSFLF